MVDLLVLLEDNRRRVTKGVVGTFGNTSYHALAIFVILFWITATLGTAFISGPFALVGGFPTCLALVVAGFVCLFTIVLAPVGVVFL
jgi:hypothetical protein